MVSAAISLVLLAVAAAPPSASASRYEWTAEPPFEIQEYCQEDPCNVNITQDPAAGIYHADATLGPSPEMQVAYASAWTTLDAVLDREVPWAEALMHVQLDIDLASAPDGGSATSFVRYHYDVHMLDKWCGGCYAGTFDIPAEIGYDPCFYCEDRPTSLHELRTISVMLADPRGEPIPAGNLRFSFDLETHARIEPANADGSDYWMAATVDEDSASLSGFGDPTQDPENFYLNVSAGGQSVGHDGSTSDPPPPSQPMASFNVTMTILDFQLKTPKPNEIPRLPPGRDRNYTIDWAPPYTDAAGGLGTNCDADEPDECVLDAASGTMGLNVDTGSGTFEPSDTGEVSMEIPVTLGAADDVVVEATLELSSAHAEVAEVVGDNYGYVTTFLNVESDACACYGSTTMHLVEAGSGNPVPGTHPTQRGPETITIRTTLHHIFDTVMPPGDVTVLIKVRAGSRVDTEDWPFMAAGLASASAAVELQVTSVRLLVNPGAW